MVTTQSRMLSFVMNYKIDCALAVISIFKFLVLSCSQLIGVK